MISPGSLEMLSFYQVQIFNSQITCVLIYPALVIWLADRIRKRHLLSWAFIFDHFEVFEFPSLGFLKYVETSVTIF